MKVAAHPLLVAVALGLLAPPALEAVNDEVTRRRDHASTDPEPDAPVLVSEPDADDLHRVEIEWLRLS